VVYLGFETGSVGSEGEALGALEAQRRGQAVGGIAGYVVALVGGRMLDVLSAAASVVLYVVYRSGVKTAVMAGVVRRLIADRTVSSSPSSLPPITGLRSGSGLGLIVEIGPQARDLFAATVGVAVVGAVVDGALVVSAMKGVVEEWIERERRRARVLDGEREGEDKPGTGVRRADYERFP